jgi:hypothetical protein
VEHHEESVLAEWVELERGFQRSKHSRPCDTLQPALTLVGGRAIHQ